MEQLSGSPCRSDLFHRLKVSTADVHERVEQTLDIFTDGFDLASYRRLLERFYGYWAPLELQLCRVDELDHPDLALRGRLKAHLLEADLRVFEADPALVGRCTRLPRVDTFARALGGLYVLEGSTLGSQLIAKHIRERFQLGEGSGASFFNAYGPAVATRWTEFRKFVRLHAEQEPADEVLIAARETFEALACWLER